MSRYIYTVYGSVCVCLCEGLREMTASECIGTFYIVRTMLLIALLYFIWSIVPAELGSDQEASQRQEKE